MKTVKSPYISLSDSVLYRPEYFGGILFNTSTGTMIDVDREAYLLVELIKNKGVVDINDLAQIWVKVYGRPIKRKAAIGLIEKLLDFKMLVVTPNGLLHKDDDEGPNQWNQTIFDEYSPQLISAPETAHWAVTFQCDSDCPDCYIKRHSGHFTTELETEEALVIIDRIADAGVFQLAIGGGEPLLRADIMSIVARAHERKLVVHVTTGRYEHEPNVLGKLANYIKSLQIGIKHEELLEHPEKEKEKLTQLITMASELGLDIGANLILSNSTLSKFEYIIELLATAGFQRLNLLRYKPPGDINRWVKEKPDEHLLWEFERNLSKAVDTYPHIQFRVDCGLTFLERELPSQIAESNGIRGCTAANRILSIAPNGGIFPCSQLVGQDMLAGNILEDDLQSVWRNSEVLKRYRRFRTKKSFKGSQCGHCSAKNHCGGCRVFAEDALGGDPGCPEWELDDIIAEIQEGIGFTDGGCPYASFEEIRGWLVEEEYPKWLLRKTR